MNLQSVPNTSWLFLIYFRGRVWNRTFYLKYLNRANWRNLLKYILTWFWWMCVFQENKLPCSSLYHKLKYYWIKGSHSSETLPFPTYVMLDVLGSNPRWDKQMRYKYEFCLYKILLPHIFNNFGMEYVYFCVFN